MTLIKKIVRKKKIFLNLRKKIIRNNFDTIDGNANQIMIYKIHNHNFKKKINNQTFTKLKKKITATKTKNN